jgi:hypothetical protein
MQSNLSTKNNNQPGNSHVSQGKFLESFQQEPVSLTAET